MGEIERSLPSRPLALTAAEQLERRDGRFVVLSVRKTEGETVVDTLLIEGHERFRGVGYDAEQNHWKLISEQPGHGTLEGLPEKERERQREAVLDEVRQWIERKDEAIELRFE